MDLSTVIGMLMAFGCILGGNILEGGTMMDIYQPVAVLIVGGGALGATIITYPMDQLISAIGVIKQVLLPLPSNAKKLITELVEFSNLARREGILALEAKVETIKTPFLKKGLQMVVDGSDAEMLVSTLETEIETFEHHSEIAVKIFETFGGFAPTIGIIGAVFGLIGVMKNLDDPAKIGGGIAVAFVATIYGLMIANVICLPMAGKLKARAHEQVQEKQIILQGLVSLQNGENPAAMKSRLEAFLHEHH